ncbi:MAG: AAA family ATPase [Proteobacteria bacterium]|nr:AAA family ATPase [Pseudomonadota bacterium]
MYIKNLSIENLRCFNKAELEFTYSGRKQDEPFKDIVEWPPTHRNVNVILGINGVGKSTVLNAIALAILSSVISSSGYNPYLLVRRTKGKRTGNRTELRAELLLHEQDVTEPGYSLKQFLSTETEIFRRGDHEQIKGKDEDNPVWEGMFDDRSPAFLMVGYSATRRVEPTTSASLTAARKQRQLRYQRVASLFEDHFALTPLTHWLPELESENPGRYKQVINLINRLLPQGTSFLAQLQGGEYIFKHGGAELPFGALSDGFRAYIGWIGDLLYHICMGCPSGVKLVANRGIVLVDEIDLHIHPEWQLTLIPRLARTLRNIQFIFTTHSPIVVGTLERANIYHLRTRGTQTLVERPDFDTYGLTAEQILRSDVFGLETTRVAGFVKVLRALQSSASSGDSESAKELMRKVARGRSASIPEDEIPDWVKRKKKAQAGS